MAILAAAGDPGGLNALVPALKKFLSAGGRLLAWKHRDLPAALPGVPLWEGGDLPAVERMVFATSVADAAPLRLARRCRAAGIRVECVLDNWMNYRRRLEIDGEGLFVPDSYYVMDDLAREEAIKEGLPARVLVVSGHPALSDLRLAEAGEREGTRAAIRMAMGIPEDHRILVFVSEPVEQDQGADVSFPGYRGYTEKQVLAELCSRLRSADGKWGLCVLAHPREDLAALARTWKANSASLAGGVYRAGTPTARQIVAAADGVAGMASILLYEAWLMGRPTLSLQPGLIRPDLRIFRARAGVHCVQDAAQLGKVKDWLDEARREKGAPRAEISSHQGSADFLARAWLSPNR